MYFLSIVDINDVDDRQAELHFHPDNCCYNLSIFIFYNRNIRNANYIREGYIKVNFKSYLSFPTSFSASFLFICFVICRDLRRQRQETVIKVCLQLESTSLLSPINYSQDLFDPVQANPQISYGIERQSVNIILNTILISGICIVRIVDVSAKKDDQPQCHLPRSWCGSQNKNKRYIKRILKYKLQNTKKETFPIQFLT